MTNRYTGQRIDEETGLYYYNSRYYDAQLGRFIQADSIVPGSDTSQALNRYAYVKNNPLNFTDPDGHGWFSKLWKNVKQWIGTIITVALNIFAPGLGTFLSAVIGSAVGTLVNGGTFASFAIGVAVGFAAGEIVGAIGGYLNGGGTAGAQAWADYASSGIGQFVAGAATGATAGGISSAIYGQNIGKGMLEGAKSGIIGAGIASAILGIHTYSAGILGANYDRQEGLVTIVTQKRNYNVGQEWPGIEINEYVVNSGQDILDIFANIDANKVVTFFEYTGHGWPRGLSLANGDLTINDLLNNQALIQRVFSPTARIELQACQTARVVQGVNVPFAQTLLGILPNANIVAYTGKPIWFDVFFNTGYSLTRGEAINVPFVSGRIEFNKPKPKYTDVPVNSWN